MTTRPSLVAMLCTGALLLGAYGGSIMSLSPARADEAPPKPSRSASQAKRPPPDPNKAQVGDRCKTSSDCDHSSENIDCVPVGDHKECARVPSKRPLVPVVT